MSDTCPPLGGLPAMLPWSPSVLPCKVPVSIVVPPLYVLGRTDVLSSVSVEFPPTFFKDSTPALHDPAGTSSITPLNFVLPALPNVSVSTALAGLLRL